MTLNCIVYCRDPAISLHSHTVSLVQWGQSFASCHEGPRFNPKGGTYVILLIALSRYIGDPYVIPDHCDLVRGGLRPEPSLGPRANNMIIPLDLTQLFCPGFTLAAGSSFTTELIGCWGRGGGALWRACNLTTFTHSHTGSVGQPFASCYEGPGFNPQGGTYVKPGYSC